MSYVVRIKMEVSDSSQNHTSIYSDRTVVLEDVELTKELSSTCRRMFIECVASFSKYLTRPEPPKKQRSLSASQTRAKERLMSIFGTRKSTATPHSK